MGVIAPRPSVTQAAKMMILLVLALAASAHGARLDKQGIFSVVKFANDACQSADTGYNGTCMTSTECTNVGGSASGSCAEGFGVCCVLTVGSGTTSSTNNTYLVQSSTTSAGSHTYTICPTNTDVCKLRIDFEKFVTTAASATATIVGSCADDVLLITDPTTSREWNIKVTQIECSNKLLPPSGCLQYFTGTTGYLYNFGWVAATTSTAASSTKHLNSQDYTMCIRREEGYCSMEYFSEHSAGFGISAPGANPPAAVFGDVACVTDYLVIPGIQNSGTAAGTAQVAIQGDRICGDNWSVFPNAAGAAAATFLTYRKPFTVSVHTDGSEQGTTTANNGFAILFTQKKCA